MKHTGKTVAAALIGTLLLGCQPPPKPAPPAPVPSFSVPDSRAKATTALVTQTDQFDTDVERLPGVSAEEHRQILLALLDNLPKILRLANGPTESPDLQNRLSVIEGAKKTINDSGVDRRRMEAVENQALQAAAPALANIVSQYLYDDDQMPALLQTLNDKIDIAAGSVGPMHDLDATNAFTAMQAVVDRLTADMAERYLR
jgi:hypothetical protein